MPWKPIQRVALGREEVTQARDPEFAESVVAFGLQTDIDLEAYSLEEPSHQPNQPNQTSSPTTQQPAQQPNTQQPNTPSQGELVGGSTLTNMACTDS